MTNEEPFSVVHRFICAEHLCDLTPIEGMRTIGQCVDGDHWVQVYTKGKRKT